MDCIALPTAVMAAHCPRRKISLLGRKDGGLVTAEQERLVNAHLGWAKNHARKLIKTTFLPGCVLVDDLWAYGCLGLIDAAKRFDPERGVKFKTFAQYRVIGAMHDGLREMDWMPRGLRAKVKAGEHPEVHKFSLDIPCSEQAESFSDPLEVPVNRSLQDATESRELAATAIKKVFGKHRAAIRKFFFEHKTMTQVGDEMGLTESRISQIVKEALEIMREALGVTEASFSFNCMRNRKL